jgi:hypothetical protein
LVASSLYYDIFQYIPDFWKDVADDAFFRCETICGYAIYYYTLKIIPQRFSQLLSLSDEETFEHDQQIQNLLDNMRSSDFQVGNLPFEIEKWLPVDLSFSFLIPEAASPLERADEQDDSLIIDICDYLKLSGTAALPSRFRGSLFCFQRTIRTPDSRAIVVNLAPPADAFARNNISLSSTFLHYCECRACIRICRQIRSHMSKSVAYYQDIGRLTKTIEDLRDLDEIQRRITRDRMQSIRLRFATEKCLRDLLQKMQNNYFRDFDSASYERIELLNEKSPNFISRWHFLTQHEDMWSRAVYDVRREIEETKERDKIFSDYLRDLLAGRNASANIALQKVNVSLQKSVRRLTTLATILALLGFGWSLLPDPHKDRLFYLLLEQWDVLVGHVAVVLMSI